MTTMISLPEGQLALDDQGTGPLVVCAPGMGDLRAAYRHVVPGLVARGFRVVTVDLRGHGESAVTYPSYGPEEVGRDLVALVQALGEPAVLVGHSASAAAAVWAAAEAPERVVGLVLVGPVVRDPKMPKVVAALLPWLFLPSWGARMWGWFYSTLFKAGRPADHAEHVAAVVQALREPARRRAMLDVGMRSKAGCAARAEQVKVPVLALLGGADGDVNPEDEAAWLQEALQADARVLPGVGHEPHQEVPDAVVHAIAAFVQERVCPAA